MSRGFVKEDDQEEVPFVPPRASLPDGVPNYVTPRGLALLLKEREQMETERAAVPGNEDERRREQAAIDARLALLNERIVTARVVEPTADTSEVRFGSTVTFRYADGPQRGTTRSFMLVGVDEASIAGGRIAFTAPLARALMGRRCGDEVPFTAGAVQQRLHIVAIANDQPS